MNAMIPIYNEPFSFSLFRNLYYFYDFFFFFLSSLFKYIYILSFDIYGNLVC